MDSSAPKRRRTSPRTAVAVQPDSESTTPRDAPPRPGAASSRPSFASPTRASLERYNPDILRRRESQPRRLRSSPDAPASPTRATTPDSAGSLAQALRTQLELRSGARDRPPQAGSDADGVLRSPPRRLARTPTKPTPRPLPPPAPEHDDELLRAITGRVRPVAGLGVLPDMTAPEPELPPTPEHPDPVVSTPPSGIHNTPSRRPKRSRALAGKLKSSSPLKQPPVRPPELPRKGAQVDLEPTAEETETDAPPAPTTAELRGLKPADPDSEKKKLRDVLLAEITQLERDLDIASHENERIRQARLARHDPHLPPTNKSELLDLLARNTLPPDEDDKEPGKADPAEDWLASALNPIAFLPFSNPSRPPTLPPPPAEPDLPPPTSHHPLPMTAAEALPYLQVFTPLTFSSHVSPLPPQHGEESTGQQQQQQQQQQHTITARSSSPNLRGLFTARIDMTVDTRHMRVARLAVPRLEPAAEAELRPFIDRVVGGGLEPGGGSSGLYNNVSVLSWAMGEWLRVAVQRARVWRVLEAEVGDRVVLGGMVARRRAGEGIKGRGRVGKRKRKRFVEEEDEEEREDEDGDEEQAESGQGEGHEEDGEDEDGEGPAGKYDAADLLPYMGSTCLDLEVPVLGSGKGETSALRVQWRIAFDWTGEAASEMGVLVGVPGKWHRHDERGRLSGLPKLFDELIQSGEGPLAAVRTVVCLLAGEQRS